MAVETELDGPPPGWEEPCWMCGRAVQIGWIWWDLGNRWLRNPPIPVHVKCADSRNQDIGRGDVASFKPPPKYAEQFEALHFKNDVALTKALEFGPDSRKHFFAIVGHPRKGKSRLCWSVMSGFFAELATRGSAHQGPETFSWADLVDGTDPYKTGRLKVASYVYLGDAGSTEIFGRARAMVCAALRFRLERNMWTFCDIDDSSFDQDFVARLRTEAFSIWLE